MARRKKITIKPKEKPWFTSLFNPFSVSGLKPNTTYTSKLHVVDELGDRTEWNKDIVFKTFPPTPIIDSFTVGLGKPSDKNIVIKFSLTLYADIKNIQIITDDGQVLYKKANSGQQKDFTVNIGNLTPEKQYTLFLIVEDIHGQTIKSKYAVITMMPEKPVITDLIVSNRGQDFLEVLVKYDSKISITNYKYEVNNTTVNTSVNPYKIGGLTIGTEYAVEVTISDANGNISEPFTKSFYTSTDGPIITDIVFSEITDTTAVATVNTTSALPVKDYTFYFNNKSQTQISNTFELTDLTPYTEYYVTVVARDELYIPSAEITRSFKTLDDGIVVSSCNFSNITATTIDVDFEFSSKTPIKQIEVYIKFNQDNIFNFKEHNKFIDWQMAKGTELTLLTNGIPSAGGNIRFINEDDTVQWFSIDVGKTRVVRNLQAKVKGYYNELNNTTGIDYNLNYGKRYNFLPFIGYESDFIKLLDNPYYSNDFTITGLRPNSQLYRAKFLITNIAGKTVEYQTQVELTLNKSNFYIENIDVSNIEDDSATISATINSDYDIVKYELYINDELKSTQTGLPFSISGLIPNTKYKAEIIGYNKYDWKIQRATLFTTEQEKISVSFETGDGSDIQGLEVAKGSRINLDEYVTEQEGYNFLGWYIGDTKYSGNYIVNSNVVFTAKWSIKQLTITYKSFNKTVKTERVPYGGNGTPPILEEVDGYDFVEWNPEPLHVTTNLTVTAVYTPWNTMVIYYPIIDGYTAQPESQSVPFGSEFTTAIVNVPNQERELVSWAYTNQDFEITNYTPNTRYNMDILYEMPMYAVYDKYMTRFDAMGGTGGTLHLKNLVTVGAEVPIPEMKYELSENLKAELLGVSNSELFENVIPSTQKTVEQQRSDTIYYAYWSYPIKYYNVSSLDGKTTSMTLKSEEITIQEEPSTEYKTFLGWQISINGVEETEQPKTYTIPAGEVAFYEFRALWEIKTDNRMLAGPDFNEKIKTSFGLNNIEAILFTDTVPQDASTVDVSLNKTNQVVAWTKTVDNINTLFVASTVSGSPYVEFVTNMQDAFKGFNNVNKIDFGYNVFMDSVVAWSNAFEEVGINVTGKDVIISGLSADAFINAVDTQRMFYRLGIEADKVIIENAENWKMPKVQYAYSMFYGVGARAKEVQIAISKNWNLEKYDEFSNAFQFFAQNAQLTVQPELKIVKTTAKTKSGVFENAVEKSSTPFLVYDNGDDATFNIAEEIVATKSSNSKVFHVRQINYNANGGTMPGSYVKEYSGFTEIQLPQPTKDGYDFVSWERTSTEEYFNTLPSGLTGRINLTAKYIEHIVDTTIITGTEFNDKIKSLYDINKITNISFANKIPENVKSNKYYADVSNSRNGQVVVWINEGSNDIVQLNIGANLNGNKIIANSDSSSMFSKFEYAKTIMFNEIFDMSTITNASNMFESFARLTTSKVTISGIVPNDLRNITNATAMFAGFSQEFNEHEIPNMKLWNFSNLQIADNMFNSALYHSDIWDLEISSNWWGNKLVSANNMFENAGYFCNTFKYNNYFKVINTALKYTNIFHQSFDRILKENTNHFIVQDNSNDETFNIAEVISNSNKEIFHERSISYNVNGGQMPSSYNKIYYGYSNVTLPKPRKTDGIFKGWALSRTAGETVYTESLPSGLTGRIDLIAKWEIVDLSFEKESTSMLQSAYTTSLVDGSKKADELRINVSGNIKTLSYKWKCKRYYYDQDGEHEDSTVNEIIWEGTNFITSSTIIAMPWQNETVYKGTVTVTNSYQGLEFSKSYDFMISCLSI